MLLINLNMLTELPYTIGDVMLILCHWQKNVLFCVHSEQRDYGEKRGEKLYSLCNGLNTILNDLFWKIN